MVTRSHPISHIYIFLFFILSGVLFSSPAADALTAQDSYIEADGCYKKLRTTPSKKKYASEWLKCIHRYESIYKNHPQSSWAPAGMYKASQLYLNLSRLSGKNIYKTQAADLLARLKNRYPESAYARRAKTLMRSEGMSSKIRKKEKHLFSKKQQTINRDRIEQLITEKTTKTAPVTPSKADPPEQKTDPVPLPPVQSVATPKEDTTITDLRFWSNPEYTRIVVNAEEERDFFHRLLKKDPDINKPFQRLYIDIDQSRLGKDVAEHTPINDNLLKQARAGQYLPHTVRVVIDIKSFENYKIFSLKDPFRIVIDVWGKGSNGGPSGISGKGIAATGPDTRKHSQITTDNIKSSDIARQLALGVRKIVIDPGHGGSDPGAPGYFKNVWEKDIVLKLAKKLSVTLRERLKCTVLLTRTTDKKLTLEERTAIANTKRADLFISLHCNAAKNRRLRGIETYILNLATDDQAIAVAARENATSEKNISDLEYILSDLMKYAKIEESKRLANVVHKSFVSSMKKKYTDVNDLGVKQAPFYVLLGARMPSILIETSFISNKKECQRLMSDAYQTAVCKSIADGVEKYIDATNPRQL